MNYILPTVRMLPAETNSDSESKNEHFIIKSGEISIRDRLEKRNNRTRNESPHLNFSLLNSYSYRISNHRNHE